MMNAPIDTHTYGIYGVIFVSCHFLGKAKVVTKTLKGSKDVTCTSDLLFASLGFQGISF